MSGIKEITLSNQASSVYGVIANSLSDDTQKKLRRYGISISSIRSENHARQIIKTKETENTKKEENTKKQESQNLSERTLYFKLKKIANKIGIDISNATTIRKIVSKIENKMNELIVDAEKNNDYDKLKKFEKLGYDFSELKTTERLIRQNYLMITASMDNLATINRALLGI